MVGTDQGETVKRKEEIANPVHGIRHGVRKMGAGGF